MDDETARRLRDMLTRYEKLRPLMTDAKMEQALDKLIADARSQLSKHGTGDRERD